MDRNFKYAKRIYCKLTGETVNGYKNYLHTAHWKNIRKMLINKKTRCCMCGDNLNLQVHHNDYSRLGHENIKTDLIVVCFTCHSLYHHDKDMLKKFVKRNKVSKKH